MMDANLEPTSAQHAPPLPSPQEVLDYPIPLLSDSVSLVWTEGLGRGLRLTEDIEAGETLIIEDAFLPCDDDMGVMVRHLIAILVQQSAGEAHAEKQLSALLALCPESFDTLPEEQMKAVRFVEAFCAFLAASEAGESIAVREAAATHTTLLCHLAVKVAMNSFGSGVYLWVSMLNHECDPNCEVVHEGGVTHIVSNRASFAGQNLSIRYGPAPELFDRYGFCCSCGSCEANMGAGGREEDMAELKRQRASAEEIRMLMMKARGGHDK